MDRSDEKIRIEPGLSRKSRAASFIALTAIGNSAIPAGDPSRVRRAAPHLGCHGLLCGTAPASGRRKCCPRPAAP